MKQTLITIAIVASFALFVGATMPTDKQAARVETVNGIDVFCYSKPLTPYDIIGNVKIKGMVSNEKGEHMVDLLTEKTKKDFPSGEAIIIGLDFYKAEVIKFK